MPTKRLRRRQGLPEKFAPGFLKEMDLRTAVGRELRAAYEDICDDCGGEETMTHTKLVLVEQFCFLEILLGHWQLEIAEDPKNAQLVGRWSNGCNVLVGLAKTLGLERRMRPGRLAAKLEAAQCQ